MWPGCETKIKNYKPTYMEPYSKKFTLTQKMDQVLGWLDLPSQDRPGFIGVYVSDVDTAGHNYGPDSDIVKEKVQNVDQMIGHLTEGLKSRNLNDIVNVILVSDHGMAQVDNKNVIYLDDYIDTDLIADTHLYPLAGIIPKDLSKVQDIYNQLKRKVNSTSKWDVYLREEIPDRFHFKNNMRIPPIVGIQESGWAFTTHKEYPDSTQPFHPAGLHGYDNTHPDMRALFIANGPYFSQMSEQDVKPLSPFQNLEVYGLLTDILGVEFAPNNGTQLLSRYFKSSVSA
jgi:predicted AlkP superfamily pyrophosphatase or phosphodiesterase